MIDQIARRYGVLPTTVERELPHYWIERALMVEAAERKAEAEIARRREQLSRGSTVRY